MPMGNGSQSASRETQIEMEKAGRLSSFLDNGIYPMDEGPRVLFLDPVRILRKSYSRSGDRIDDGEPTGNPSESSFKKRKRKKKKNKMLTKDLNEREIAAELRHQEARPFLLRAHGCLLRATDLLSVLPSSTIDDDVAAPFKPEAPPCDFIALGASWKAPFQEISLIRPSLHDSSRSRISTQLFDNLVANDTDDDLEAEFISYRYILPSRSCFFMSDLKRIRDLIPAHSDDGYNLIVIDPPWENASASQKSSYPTLSSRHFLYLPLRQLAHTQGALVALWVTHKEKLRIFVERELLPSWGVTSFSLIHWLKVKVDGSLTGDVDSFHHRPYECLVLAHVKSEVDVGSDGGRRLPESNQVIISVPGAYSRKPPLAEMLREYVAKPGKSLELFARELHSGWISWGNEPLHFQDASNF